MKKTWLLLLAALCLTGRPAAAEGLPDFLEPAMETATTGASEPAAQQELELTLEMDEARIEAGQTLTLRVTAANPLSTPTQVAFALSLPQRLACGQETVWTAVLPAAQDGEKSVTVFERELTLLPGGASETAQIVCEMSMGTRFYRAAQEIALCVADVTTQAQVVSEKGERLEPGDAFAYRITLRNTGAAASEVELAMVLPDGVSLEGDAPAGMTRLGSRLTGKVFVPAAAQEPGVSVVELPVRVEETALEDDADASRLLCGVLYADGVRVPVPRVQACEARISARLLPEKSELAAGETMALRLLVANEGLVGADVSLVCALPEGLIPVDAQDTSASAPATSDEATAGESAKNALPAQANAAELAQTGAAPRVDGNDVYVDMHMDAARETPDGLLASTRVIELHVRADAQMGDAREKLVGASLAFAGADGGVQLGEAAALRVYRPSIFGVTEEDWAGIFWASLLMITAVVCLWAAVRSDKREEG